MIKRYCDWCKREIPRGQEVTESSPWSESSLKWIVEVQVSKRDGGRFDVCRECILNFLKGSALHFESPLHVDEREGPHSSKVEEFLSLERKEDRHEPTE